MNTKEIALLVLGVVVLLLLVYEGFLRGNFTAIQHSFVGRGNMVNLPIDTSITSYISGYLATIPNIESYTLTDIGSGDGAAIKLMRGLFRKSIGIDNDHDAVVRSRANLAAYADVEIVETDMAEYEFQDIPTVIFMYEPLFLMPVETAIDVYTHCFDNLRRYVTANPVYVAYISGISAKYLSPEFFRDRGMTMLHQTVLGSYFLNRNVYILKLL